VHREKPRIHNGWGRWIANVGSKDKAGEKENDENCAGH